MSTEYKAYFRLKNQTVEINKLQAFLTEYQFQYEDRPSYFVRNEDGFLREKLHDHYADWSQFVREVKELDFSPNAAIVHDSFYFALGFVKLDHETFSVFDISEGNLEDLSEFMKERNSNVLQFFLALYQTLKANAMVWGKELSFEEASAFLKGALTPSIISDYVRTAVGVLPARSLELLRSYGGRDFTIGNLKGVTQPFLGLEELPLPAPRVNWPEPVRVTTRPGVTENLDSVLVMKPTGLHA